MTLSLVYRRSARSARFAGVALLALAALAGGAYAEEIGSAHGFSIDLPEGMALLSSDGKDRFSFGPPDGLFQLDILVYDAARYADAGAMAQDVMRRLSAQGSTRRFVYAGMDAALSELRFGSGTGATRGHAVFLNGTPRPTPTPAPGSAGSVGAAQAAPPAYDLALLAYAPSSSYARAKDLMLSTLDGFSTGPAYRAAPGPVGTAARAGLGAERPVQAQIRFGQALISVPWLPAEGLIAQEIVEREYRVLTPYGARPDLITEAMRRFYRMVWRDGAPSLDRLGLELAHAWENGSWAGIERPANFVDKAPTDEAAALAPPQLQSRAPDSDAAAPRFGAPARSRDYAATLLSWVQTWRYERDPSGSDVVNPLSAAMEGRGDCDSRVLVMLTLLRRENIPGILLVSLKHQHALAGLELPGPGARFPYKQKQWLVAETTAPVGIGLIDQAQSGIADWFAVDFAP